jgi:transposase
LARELGIRVSMLYKWRMDYDKFGTVSFPSNGILKQTAEQNLISELEAKLKEAKLERDILKKAVDIFSKSGR